MELRSRARRPDADVASHVGDARSIGRPLRPGRRRARNEGGQQATEEERYRSQSPPIATTSFLCSRSVYAGDHLRVLLSPLDPARRGFAPLDMPDSSIGGAKSVGEGRPDRSLVRDLKDAMLASLVDRSELI